MVKTPLFFVERYKETVSDYPHAVAIEWEGHHYTHVQLWNMSIQILGLIQSRGIQKGMHIGLYMRKSPEFVASILACWMGGFVFVPLDPSLPKERLLFYALDSELSLVIFHEKRLDDTVEQVCVEEVSEVGVLVSLNPSDAAYLLYSSGSTGTPKGILISHRGIVLMLTQQCVALSLTVEDRVLWFLSMQFDASISDVGVSLLSGATIVIDEQGDPISRLHKHNITYADLPPVWLRIYEPEAFPISLRCILIGGEVCLHSALEKHRKYRRIVLVYGPTEATICTSLVVCDAQNGCSESSMGYSIEGVCYHIEEEELWISGETLALGYWNRTDLDHKWVQRDGLRYFRSGDRVVQTKEGEFSFVGRLDRQIKLHGKLIAPEEIEHELCRLPSVQRAFVSIHHGSLYAFVESIAELEYKDCMSSLRVRIPDWMIPKIGFIWKDLPCTPSGKIDGVTLHKQILKSAKDQEETLEDLWCRIFSEALSTVIHPTDDFLKKGGDSISLLALLVAAQKKGFSLTPEKVRIHPTPRSLSIFYREKEMGRSVEELEEYVQRESLLRSPRDSSSLSCTESLLLTGATGFFGRQVLAILCHRGLRVRVLVRAQSTQEAKIRIDPEFRDSVDIVVGDLCDSEAIKRFIGRGEGTLFHCAAGISQMKSFHDLYDINIRASARLFAYPQLSVVYASTLAVLLSTDRPRRRLIEQSLSNMEDYNVFGGYAQSKWVAERLADKGASTIVRLGLIVDETEPPRGDWFSLFVRGIVVLGMLPYAECTEARLDWTPLSYAAERFVSLGLDVPSKGVYHLASQKGVSFAMLVEVIQQLGYSIQDCSLSDFRTALEKHKDEPSVRVVQLASHYLLTKEMEHRQLDMFLATGSSFDSQRVHTIFGTGCPSPTMSHIRSVVRTILER